MRGGDPGCGRAHLVGEEGDVSERDVDLGVGVCVGPGILEEHVVAALRGRKTDAAEEGRRVATERSKGEAARSHAEIQDATLATTPDSES